MATATRLRSHSVIRLALCYLTTALLLIAPVSATVSFFHFCPDEPVPYCTCHNSTLSINCSGDKLTSVPATFNPSVQILFIEDANLEILESIPYNHLVSLYLEKNKIRYIKEDAFKSLNDLTSLYLTNNEISGLTNSSFDGLKNLSLIKLSLNPIFVLKSSVFSHTKTPNLTEIRLEECRLYEVEPHAFALLNQLAYLNLSYNYLKSIPVFQVYDEMESLHTLDLSGNRIQTMAGAGLGNLRKLQTLHLHTNLMERITRQDMMGLHHTLRFLDVSKNKISWIEATAFTEMRQLSELYLEGNAITSMYWEELPWDYINKITLMNNPWDCTCNNSWIVEDNSPQIRFFNDNENTKCASPASVANQPVFSVPLETFACKKHRSSRTAMTAVFAVVVSLIGIAAIVIVILKIKKRRKAEYNQPYTKVTVNGGIHM